MKYKVGIYLRLSSEDKDKIYDNSESIKNQRNMLLDYINNNSNFILVDEYCDEDISGAGTYRPEFERLIKDCEQNKIDIVLCKSQSRFSRDMEIVEKYINNKFKEWNIRFISLSDNADTNNSGNKKSRQINGLVNEWFLEDISNNIRSAFNSKMKQGEFISPFAPFGYKNKNNKLLIDSYASKVVKDIYKLYLNGYSYTAIANYLNNNNIPSPSYYKFLNNIKLNVISNKKRKDIKWNPNAIKNILTNEVYIGNLIQGKRTTVSYKNHKIILKNKTAWIKRTNTHESIIDELVFNKVQELINKRTKSLKKNKMIHIFSGKVYSLEYNKLLRLKNSGKHYYLVCPNNSIRYDYLEDVVLNELNNLIAKYYDTNIIRNELSLNNDSNSLLVQKKQLIKNIKKNNSYLEKIYKDRLDNLITTNEFKKLLKTYENNNQLLNNKLILINKKIKSTKEIIDLKKYNHFDKLTTLIVDEFINRIIIIKDTIIIEWNMKSKNLTY